MLYQVTRRSIFINKSIQGGNNKDGGTYFKLERYQMVIEMECVFPLFSD